MPTGGGSAFNAPRRRNRRQRVINFAVATPIATACQNHDLSRNKLQKTNVGCPIVVWDGEHVKATRGRDSDPSLFRCLNTSQYLVYRLQIFMCRLTKATN